MQGSSGGTMKKCASSGVHAILGRAPPAPMRSKPEECLATEVSIEHRDQDVYIVTFPKTGTTLLSFICHLLRHDSPDADAWLQFKDICEVVPHTSSAWFIDQNLNTDQPGICRLYKSHRKLEQVGSWCSTGLRYITTIRDPTSTLLSLHRHRVARRRFNSDVPSILEYALSSAWQQEHMPGCIPCVWTHYKTMWQCRHADNLLVIPYESLCRDKRSWLRVIASFLGTPLTEAKSCSVLELTSREWMLEHVSLFDESWVAQRRAETGREHPTIVREAPKVHSCLEGGAGDEDTRTDIVELNGSLWRDKVARETGCVDYMDMVNALCRIHSIPTIP